MDNKPAILLVNLGTPDSTSVSDVRRYLRQFLMDRRVIDIPFISRWLLVNLIIATFRAPKSAKVYREVWTKEGSPIKVFGYKVQELLQAKLASHKVYLAMRYQNPSIAEVMEQMRKAAHTSIKVVPMFPQYASATSGSVHDEVMRIIKEWEIIPPVDFISQYYDHPLLIEGFVQNAKERLKDFEPDHILFSYHGLPERQIYKGDEMKVCKLGSCCEQITEKNQFCYRAQCFATTYAIADKMGLSKDQYGIVFQSRLGKTPWIQPYAEDTVIKLAKEGKKRILMFSPAFVADCLETIVEIGDEYNELFQEHGGEKVVLVESLNDKPIWIDCLADLVGENK